MKSEFTFKKSCNKTDFACCQYNVAYDFFWFKLGPIYLEFNPLPGTVIDGH